GKHWANDCPYWTCVNTRAAVARIFFAEEVAVDFIDLDIALIRPGSQTYAAAERNWVDR
ncbi:MAG: hypothetical protein ACJAYV_001939, partial [Oleispira sp.]